VKKSEKEAFLREFGKHLADLRREKGLSQEQLAIDAEIDLSTLSCIERGVFNISIVNAYKIASALGLHNKELYAFDPPTSKK
jgi:transcriptional regulator with XRE-family HTH domain